MVQRPTWCRTYDAGLVEQDLWCMPYNVQCVMQEIYYSYQVISNVPAYVSLSKYTVGRRCRGEGAGSVWQEVYHTLTS